MADPEISVVTPSFNQGRFIERTIRSVLRQAGPSLEYVVVDGGSTDETLNVLRRFEGGLRWVSEADEGQADAVNKGIARTSGGIIGWLNSDDLYYPDALEAVSEYLAVHSEVDVVYGDAHHVDEDDGIIESYYCEPWDFDRLREICFLCQPAVFFRRRVVERCGLLDAGLQFCMDYEYWLRLAQHGMRFGYLRRNLAGSRMYGDNKTMGQRVRVHAEINRMLRRRLGSVPDRWVSNFAHVWAEEAGLDRAGAPRRFTATVAGLAVLGSLRWNRRVSRRLAGEARSWLLDGFRRRPERPRPITVEPVAGERPRPSATAIRVGFDVSQTGTGKTGCGFVADRLVQLLPELDGKCEFILYPTFGGDYWDPEGPGATRWVKARNVSLGPVQPSHDAARRFWRPAQADLEPRIGYPDIVHSNNFFCPENLGTARLVYTLYDLHFLDHPEWTTESNRLACFNGVFRAATRADLVVAISEASREHFLRVFPHYPPERTAVVHPASRFSGEAPARPPANRDLEPDRFFLNVATLDPRKNHLRLLQGYAEHARRHRDPRPLVLAGGRGWKSEKLQRVLAELEITRKVIWLGYVDDEELRWLYRSCFAFVYPSLAEGFGLPVVEAASQGAAVIASRIPSIEEAAGGAALLVDPTSHLEIARALDLLERDPSVVRELRASARADAARFSWRTAARRVLVLYDEVLRREKLAEQVGR